MRRWVVALLAFSAPLLPLAVLAEPPHTRVVVVPAPEAGPDVGFVPSANQPDPPPLVARKQWVWDLRWSKGEVYLLAVHDWDPGAPRETPRVIGRFAIELWEGKALIERVRFDFPLLGAPEDGGHRAAPSFQAHLTTRIGVIFPQTKRGSRFELVDRATGARWELPWPETRADAAQPEARADAAHAPAASAEAGD